MKSNQSHNELFELAETLLEQEHALSYRLKGNSMYPTLKPGDIGIVEKCAPDELKIGDILVFRTKEILVGHRLIEKQQLNNKTVFTTKGDNSYVKDIPFGEDVLLGRINRFQRKKRIIKLNSSSMKLRKFLALNYPNQTIPLNNRLLQLELKLGSFQLAYKSTKKNLSIVTQQSEKLVFINAIISIFQGLLPFLLLMCVKSLVDTFNSFNSFSSTQGHYFLTLLLATGLVFLTTGILSEIKSFYSEKLSQSVIRRMYEKLHTKHAALDLSHYENPAEQDKIHRAVQEASYRPIKIINELLIGIKSVASALFLIGLFISIKWYLMAILVVAILPGIYLRLKFSRKLYHLKELQSTREREMYYFNRVLTGFPFAKEMKLFGFFDFFKNRFYSIQESLFDEKIKLRKSELGLNILAQTFAVSLIFVALAFVSYLKIKGAISIGTVVLFFFAFQRGYGVLNDLFQSFTRILEDNTFLNDFVGFLNMATTCNSTLATDSFSLSKEIKFENVDFRYETSKRPTLKSVNITIPVGKTVALVGANGSGKSTIIKLLCGFYQPNSGKITIDGIDASNIGQNTVCQNITAVFQDFALYNISALENVALGEIQAPVDFERAKKAAQAAGIDEMLSKLPDGYSTLLGNLFKGGEELSIGQWQKIAIARAFYRNSPLILMDEPSSALDAEAELQIIDSLKKLSHNKTAVIISHRLTTVQWADIIYFLDKGEVIECGNHEELIALKGKYFSLFQTANKSGEH